MQTAENSPPAINDSGTGRRHIPITSTIGTTRKPLGSSGIGSGGINSGTSSRHLFNMSNDDIYKYTSQIISGSIPTPLKTPYTPTNTYTNSSIKVTPSTTYTRAGGVDFTDPYDQTIPSIATQVATLPSTHPSNTSTNNTSTNQNDKGHNSDPYSSPNMEIYKQGLKNLGLENESMSSVLDGLEVINTTTNTDNTATNNIQATNNNNNAYNNNSDINIYNKQQQQYEYEDDSAFQAVTQLDVLEMMDYYSTSTTTPNPAANVTAIGRNTKSASFSGSGRDFSGSGRMNSVTPVSGGGGVDRYGIM